MSTITKEWLQKAISQHESMRDEIPFGLDEDDSNMLAALRIALASLEAEAVADVVAWSSPNEERTCDVRLRRHDINPGPLYSAPPAPVSVPDNSAITQHFDTIALDTAREIMCDVNRRHEFLGGEVQLLSRIQCRIDDACRAAMLQGTDGALTNEGTIPATQIKPVADLYGISVLGGRTTTYSTGAAEASDCRVMGWSVQEYVKLERYQAAMLQGADGNSPVIPDGWVIVPAEPTAEMLQSGISAHYERNQIQIHDRPAPGPMECAYVAMLAAAPQQEVK